MWTSAAHRRRGLARRVLAELRAAGRRPRLHPHVPDHRSAAARGQGAVPRRRLDAAVRPRRPPPHRPGSAARAARRPSASTPSRSPWENRRDHARRPARGRDRRAAAGGHPLRPAARRARRGTPGAGSPPPVVAVLLAMAVNSLVTNPRWEWDVVGAYLTEESIVRGVWTTIQLTADHRGPRLRPRHGARADAAEPLAAAAGGELGLHLGVPLRAADPAAAALVQPRLPVPDPGRSASRSARRSAASRRCR